MITQATANVIKALKKTSLSLEDRTSLITAILQKLVALPLNESIVIGQSSVTINGKEMDVEQGMAFREACVSLKDNFARKIIKEELKYLAIVYGIHKATTLDQSYFAKAALWLLDEEEKILDKLI